MARFGRDAIGPARAGCAGKIHGALADPRFCRGEGAALVIVATVALYELALALPVAFPFALVVARPAQAQVDCELAVVFLYVARNGRAAGNALYLVVDERHIVATE